MPDPVVPHTRSNRPRPVSRAGVGAVALAGTLVALPSTIALPSTVDAAPTEPGAESHCVLEVVDQHATGELVTAPPVCFGTLAEALEYAGGTPLGRRDASSDELEAASSEDLAAAASGVLGVHFEHQDRTGSSITISGATCSGGYVNLSAAWINRISSTQNGCGSVTFFDGFGTSGASESTGATTVNLKALNDIANSVQYS